MNYKPSGKPENPVALFTRAWIEISDYKIRNPDYPVALFTRAWIEIKYLKARSL